MGTLTDQDAGLAPVRVMVVIEDATMRVGAAQLLSDLGTRFDVVAVAASAQEALDRLVDRRPQILLTDIDLTPIDGIDLIRLTRELPLEFNVQFVVYTALGQPSRLYDAIKGGARGFVSKESQDGELALAIEAVAKGYKYIAAEFRPQDLTERLAQDDD